MADPLGTDFRRDDRDLAGRRGDLDLSARAGRCRCHFGNRCAERSSRILSGGQGGTVHDRLETDVGSPRPPRRDGELREISARELVPGDVVLLETGNVVPADGRIVQGANLRIQESALTGESVAVEKRADVVFESEKPLGDRRNMSYMGTTVTYGHGEIAVTATGMQTQLGQIADMIQSVGAETTPLQRRLEQLGKVLAVAALAIVALISAVGWFQGAEFTELFMTAVSLAVAAVPEAMTAIVTIALALARSEC